MYPCKNRKVQRVRPRSDYPKEYLTAAILLKLTRVKQFKNRIRTVGWRDLHKKGAQMDLGGVRPI